MLFLAAFLALVPALPADAGAGVPVTIRVRPAEKDALWRATIRFARPVARFVFNRYGAGPGHFRRGGAWRVETAGYVWTEEGDREGVALAPGGRARREVTIAFPVDASHPEKDYPLFERFSDGGLLLYTKLTLRGGGEPVTVPCSQRLAARTPWLAVVREPPAP